MEKNIFNLNDKIYSNNNNILLEIIKDLQVIINKSKDDLIIKILSNVIIKMNNIINENKKNLELIKIDILSLINKRFDEINFNDKKELQLDDGSKYIGQVKNGVPEGKGIRYVYNGNIYEGDFKNGKMEGKGIYYWIDGERYDGEYRNNKREGKGIDYYSNGDRFEGDFRNDRREGKGIYYYSNGDREMGDYSKENAIGKHVMLTKYGEVKVKNY